MFVTICDPQHRCVMLVVVLYLGEYSNAANGTVQIKSIYSATAVHLHSKNDRATKSYVRNPNILRLDTVQP